MRTEVFIAIILIAISSISCTVTGEKKDGKMILRGFGAKEAVFSDGSKISKEEPIRIPNITTE